MDAVCDVSAIVIKDKPEISRIPYINEMIRLIQGLVITLMKNRDQNAQLISCRTFSTFARAVSILTLVIQAASSEILCMSASDD